MSGLKPTNLRNVMVKVGFHKMRGIPRLAAKPVSFSRRTLLHAVSK